MVTPDAGNENRIHRALLILSYLLSTVILYGACFAALAFGIAIPFRGFSLVFLPLAGWITGVIALKFAKNDPSMKRAKNALETGLFTALGFVMLMLFVVATCPSDPDLRNDRKAKSFARDLEYSEDWYFKKHHRYTDQIDQLIADTNLHPPDPSITFVFEHVSASGFTAFAIHPEGSGERFYSEK